MTLISKKKRQLTYVNGTRGSGTDSFVQLEVYQSILSPDANLKVLDGTQLTPGDLESSLW